MGSETLRSQHDVSSSFLIGAQVESFFSLVHNLALTALKLNLSTIVFSACQAINLHPFATNWQNAKSSLRKSDPLTQGRTQSDLEATQIHVRNPANRDENTPDLIQRAMTNSSIRDSLLHRPKGELKRKRDGGDFGMRDMIKAAKEVGDYGRWEEEVVSEWMFAERSGRV